MTAETTGWLHRNTATGFTAKRGLPWHGGPSYPGAVPFDVAERILGFDVESVPLYVPAPVGHVHPPIMVEGVSFPDPRAIPGAMMVDGKQAIRRVDTGDVFGVFSDGYQIHPYRDTLLTDVQRIIGGGVDIGSVGALRKGAQAWVSIEVPENFETPEGEVFRPMLLAATSHDGSLATTYKRVITRVVCDNTLSAALSEQTKNVLKIKHSKYSKLRIAEARDALALIEIVAEEYAATIKALCQVDVSDKAWSMFLDAHASLTSDKGEEKTGRALTMVVNERESLTRLWNADPRVSPWKGSAWGVLQAVNTYQHHEAIVRGMTRPERQWSRTVTGQVDTADAATMATLDRVLTAVA